MFRWLLSLFSAYPKDDQTDSLPFEEIQKRYEAWSARRAKYIEQNQQKLDRGECTWDDFTSSLADIDEKMLSEPVSRAEIDVIVNGLCGAFLTSTPEKRTQIQNFVAERRPLTILIGDLPERMVTEMRSAKDVDKLLSGLAAILIAGGRGDYRDDLTLLADLFVRAEEVGIRPKPHFQAVAKVSSAQALREGDTPLAEVLRNFHKYAIVEERRRGPFA